MKEECHHKDWKFYETDGSKAFFQCQECGEIWWEDISDRKGNDKYIAKEIPPPKEIEVNDILGLKGDD